MAQELMNMENFKGGPSAAFKAELDPSSESLADGIGGSYGIIKYKGKVWSLVLRGEQYTFLKDDGYPLEFLDFVILQQAKNKSKSYYPNYEDGNTDAPLCASIDGILPDEGVTQQQATACALCPRNVWKKNEEGKKVRECADYKRIAVLLMPAQTKKLLGEALMEPVFLRIPGASLQALAMMGEQTAKQGYHFSSYITRADFDPQQSYPKMRFKAIQALTDREAPVVLPLRKDPLALRIIGEDQVRAALPAPAAPVPQAQQVETGLVDVTPKAAAPEAAPAPAPPSTLSASRPPPPKPAPTPPAAPAPAPAPPAAPASLLETGLSGHAVTATPSLSSLATAPVSDTGEATEADTALDARIAALMPK